MASGTVYRRDSGSWALHATWVEAGKRRQLKRSGFSTKRAAQQALTALLADHHRGRFVQPRKMTVGEYLEGWLDGLANQGRRESTVNSYRRSLCAHVLPSIGNAELQALTPVELDSLYARLLTDGRRQGGGGLSKRSVRYIHTILGKAFADAERKALLVRNVVRLASPPSASSARAPEMTVWTPRDLRTFLDQLADHPHGAQLRLMAMTGLRRAEACGLRWVDVELDRGEVRVRTTITTVNAQPVVSEPKTVRSRRTIAVDPATVEVLREYHKTQTELRLLLGPDWTDHGVVFAMPDGRPWNPDTIGQAFDRLVQRSGLPRIRLHDLRHTHATHLLAAGVNARIVSERLGHASVAFTLDTYGHVLPGQQAEAAEAVAALVDG